MTEEQKIDRLCYLYKEIERCTERHKYLSDKMEELINDLIDNDELRYHHLLILVAERLRFNYDEY